MWNTRPSFAILLWLLSTTSVLCLTGEDLEHWKSLAEADIEEAFKVTHNNGRAKNVILFVGDGMDLTTITASRIYGSTEKEKGYLSFEKFPHIGTIKTYNYDKLVPDSASTATALFSGVKGNYRTGGVDGSVKYEDCTASLEPSARVDSLIDWGQAANKSTGFVTTTRVTHATPSALYAHYANRNWECEATMPASASACKDIARQLVEDLPGRNINVIMGGGRQVLLSNVTGNDNDPIDTWSCYSKDGRDLIQTWREDKLTRKASHVYLANNKDLADLDPSTEYVLGIFANGHLKQNYARDQGPNGMPSLENMTEAAIKVLQKNPEGYILVVEGGLIDFAHHRGHARQALDETVEFSKAIARAMEMTEEVADETLIIVTADHSHSLVFTGTLDRSKSVLDVAQASKMDGVGYTALLYGTGGPNNYQYYAENNTVIRPDPSNVDTTDWMYSQQAAIYTDEVKHSGTDVLVYSKGPMAHLFHTAHEQTYIAYVISFASQIGPFKRMTSSSTSSQLSSYTLLGSIVASLYNF